jgi:hypothetical protein
MWCMNTPTNNKRHPLFGRVATDSSLGIAILIAEDDDGRYWPIGLASTIGEAREIAESDMRVRMRDLERGKTPACPAVYTLWSCDLNGEYGVIRKLDAATLADVEW